MKTIDFKARLWKFTGGLMIMLAAVFIASAGYLYYVYRQLPGIKAKVSGLYQLFSAGQAPAPVKDKKQTVNGGWTNINARTSDETIEQLSAMSETEVKEKIGEAKDFDRLMNGNGLKLLKLVAHMVSKNKDDAVISDEDEKQIKAMLEKIMDDYEKSVTP